MARGDYNSKKLLKSTADPGGYQAFNTVFGEKITALRHTEIVQ